MGAIAQNNRYATIIRIEGKLMEVATEKEAEEYLNEQEEE